MRGEKYRWSLVQADNEKVKSLQVSLGIAEKLCRILVNRGVEDFQQAKTFFRPSQEHLHDPYLIKDMDKAVERIVQAIEKKEDILLIGDYDVDGVTSTTLLYLYLSKLTTQVSFHIPNRFTEGYGISTYILEKAKEEKKHLVVSMDCGIKSTKLVNAYSSYFDFIICDHHIPDTTLPNAVAVLDPKRSDCTYPFKELPACGIVYKYVQAINQQTHCISQEEVEGYLDLVALAIGADLVEMKGENRVLMSLGLSKLNRSPRTSIQVLKDSMKQSNATIQTEQVVFGLGPRMNALGRMVDANYGVQFLCETDRNVCLSMVKHIEKTNTERREVNDEMLKSALSMIEQNKHSASQKSHVLYHPEWHQGVLGILASKVQEYFYKPTIIFTDNPQGELVGSARSIEDFDIYVAIEQCAELLTKYGGHKYAAGLGLQKENLAVFQEKFESVVSKTIDEKTLIPSLQIETELSFEDITIKFAEIIEQMEPFGPQALRPKFIVRGVRFEFKPTILKEKYLKATLTQGQKKLVAFFFYLPACLSSIDTEKKYAIVCEVKLNIYNNIKSPQLIVMDLIEE